MQIRRADTRDIPGIKQLIKGGFGRDDMEKALRRRYGENTNLHTLM
jgi:N-acetylglutamate synthase-like GNAT family acetyltransferase